MRICGVHRVGRSLVISHAPGREASTARIGASIARVTFVDARTKQLRAAHDVPSEFYAERLAAALDRMPGDLIACKASSSRDGEEMVMEARYLDLIERIQSAKFRTTRFSPGYNDEEVDNFLDRLVATLRGSGLPDYSEVRNIEFTTTRLRPGYAMKDVDRFLREIAEAIRT
jgi:DivIVA domain-containing protein